MDCLFCKINNNEIPSKTVYEDDIVKVIMDINPQSNGHLLIIPKTHFNDFTEINDDTLIHINRVSVKMKELLSERLNPDGFVLTVNYGITQIIKHYHMHIIPVYKEKKEIVDIETIFKKLQ